MLALRASRGINTLPLVFRCHIVISGCRLLLQSLANSFFERWNFNAIFHSFRDVSTSGLGGHSAISVCPSVSHIYSWTLSSIEPSQSASPLSSWRISAVWVNMSVNFASLKISRVFHDMPKNFRCTNRRSDCCLISHSYSGKVIKRLRPTLDRISVVTQKPIDGLFTPKRTIYLSV